MSSDDFTSSLEYSDSSDIDDGELLTVNTQEILNKSRNDVTDLLLAHTKYPERFFTKIGVCSLIYFGAHSLMCLMIIVDIHSTRDLYWKYRIQSNFWVYLLMTVVLKMFGAFIQNKVSYFN